MRIKLLFREDIPTVLSKRCKSKLSWPSRRRGAFAEGTELLARGRMHTSQENETIVDSRLFVIVSGVQVLQRQWRRCGEVQQKDGCPVYTAYRLPRGGAEFWWVVVVFDEQFHTGPQSILQDKPQHPPLTGNARLNARSRPRAGVINSHANLQGPPAKEEGVQPQSPQAALVE